MDFTLEQCKIIHQAVKYYQIHGINFNGSEFKICDEILEKTYGKYYTQQKEQQR